MHSGRIIVKDKELPLEVFRLFRDLIYEKCAIFIDESKLDSLRISLLSRATKKNLSSYSEYYESLKNDNYSEHEFKELLNLITINETSFFRTPAHFKVLKEAVLPEIIRRKADMDRTIRIWAAGCSTGEEPYSIAMTVLIYLLTFKDWKVQILATDISERVLEIAKRGVYPERSLKTVDRYCRDLFFEKIDENNYAIKDDLKKVIEFKYFNLIGTPYPLSEIKNWDIIFCRNVTIYFKAESTKRVIHNFYRSLAAGGYLFIGHSESLNNISDEFNLVEVKGTFFYYKSAQKKQTNKTARDFFDFDKRLKPDFKPDVKEAKKEKNKDETIKFETAFICPKEDIRDETGVLLSKAEDLFNNGKIEDAIRACIEIESTDPLLWEAYFLLGLIHYNVGNAKDAVIQFKKVVYLNPRYFLVHYYLGNIYQKTGEYQNAVMSYNNAVEYLKSGRKEETRFDKDINRKALVEICENNLKEIEREAENV
ncbi:MAG: CheR family methyltransferase [bacterium]